MSVDRSFIKANCLLVVISCILPASLAWSAEKTTPVANDNSCSASPVLHKIYMGHKAEPAITDDRTQITADKTFGTREKMTLKGRVKVKSKDQTLRADQVIYNQKAQRVDTSGNIILITKDTVIKGTAGYKILNKDQAEVRNAEFYSASRNARGSAKQANIDNASQTRFKKVLYTTCKETKQVWALKAGSLKLDKNKGTGVAKNVTIKLGPVPVFYLPRISFPIDDRRKSGFLAPSLGYSERTGTDIKLPYYWNIAPNRDAVITPRNISDRGFQLAGEYRFLNTNSKGKIGFEFLPDDDQYNGDRHVFSYQLNARLSRYWRSNINLNTASDADYYTDLGSSLSSSSATQLERRIDFSYIRTDWSFLTRFQNYQPLSGVTESYQRLPQILLNGNFPVGHRLTYHMRCEAVQFDHDLNVVTGTRLDLNPAISYKLLNHPGYFLTSKLGVRYTQYELDNTTGVTSIERNLPIFSLDGGLYLDKYFSWRGKPYLQTLEPRLYYLNVPHENQSNIPIFDSSLLDFDTNQLFRENRFSGADRQSDANQITLALTTRFISESTGIEKFSATLGQIYYFDNSLVTLPGGTNQTGNNSDAVAELKWRPTASQLLKVSTQWDPDATRTKTTLFGYQYKPNNRQILNVAYRFREDNIDQTDVSTRWKLTSRLNFVGRWNYSLRDNTTVEGLAGLEYSSCCWAMRLVARSYIRDINAEKENSIQLQIVLKGLSRIGDNIGTLLQQSIHGYEDKL